MREAIHKHDSIIQRSVEENSGRLIKERGEGDSHFCVFTDANDALRAAIQIQKELPLQEWGIGAQIQVRMSLHTAQAEPHGGDYYGRDVNRCARIRSAAHGSQILVSDITRDATEGFDFLDLGLHRLMDLSEQQRIYQVLAPDIAREFPPLRSLNAIRHNLPVQLTSFIGREKELEELRTLAPRPRLISILGPGGAGKTRIALQLAAESVDQVKGGVWFVDLSPIQDPSALSQKVIEDLFIKVGVDDPGDAIAAHFQGDPMLLVLDNCEHVAHEAAVFVQRLLKSSSTVSVIATSREPLNVAGEHAYRLPPMDVKVEKAESLEEITHLDSVNLLLERARLRGFEEVLRNTRPQTILDLCKKLDGIPLALEQAAANLGVLTPDVMLARLDQQLTVLRIDDEGVEARHRTISAAIDWSFDTLTDEERTLFLDLAVFVGGWTLEAAESICDAPRVLLTMQSLVAKSLVWPEVTAHGDRRFRFLETVREYANEKGGPQTHDIRDRHLAYYSHLSKLANEAGLDAEDGKWSRILDTNYPNIAAALNRAIVDPKQAVEGLEFAVSLGKYWLRRGSLRDGGNWFQRAVDGAPHAPEALKADAINMLGIFAWYQGKLNAARIAFQTSLEIWRDAGKMSMVGAALNNLALVALQDSDTASAKGLLFEAADVFEKQNDDAKLTQALGNMAMLESREGNRDAAINLEERALRIHRRLQDRQSLGICITNLLGLYAERNDLKSHIELIEESLEIASSIESPAVTAASLDVVARLACDSQDYVLAAKLVGIASRIQEDPNMDDGSRKFRDDLRAEVQQAMGRRAFKTAFDKGYLTSESQAISLAVDFVKTLD